METAAIVQIHNLKKSYMEGGRQRPVLDDVNARIAQGEFFVMLGKSGSGKSTLLNMISGIDTPDAGRVLVDGTEITALSDTGQTLFRRDNIGIIFQFFNLIPTLTVLENITLPQELRGQKTQAQRDPCASASQARWAWKTAPTPSRTSSAVASSSGLPSPEPSCTNPSCSWPMNLPVTWMPIPASRYCSCCLNSREKPEKTLIMATHNPEIVPFADRVCRIHEGRLYISDSHAFCDTQGQVAAAAPRK